MPLVRFLEVASLAMSPVKVGTELDCRLMGDRLRVIERVAEKRLLRSVVSGGLETRTGSGSVGKGALTRSRCSIGDACDVLGAGIPTSVEARLIGGRVI